MTDTPGHVTFRPLFHKTTVFVEVGGHPVWDGSDVYGDDGSHRVDVTAVRIRHTQDDSGDHVMVDVVGTFYTLAGKRGKRNADVYAGRREQWPSWLTAIVDAHPVQPHIARTTEIFHSQGTR